MNTNRVIKLSQSAGLPALRTQLPSLFLHAAIPSQFTEPKGSEGAEWPLTLSLRRVWPEAEPTCLFTACFMFVLYYYGPLDRLLTPSRIHLVI